MSMRKHCDECQQIIPTGVHFRLDVLRPHGSTVDQVTVARSIDLCSAACVAAADLEAALAAIQGT